jgi:NitT/TauT family transport system substrate-binding protein
VLEFIQQHKLNARPVATGGVTPTFTQTMTGQVDVGWSAVPLGLDKMEEGKIRIVWRGLDVTALRGRTTRVNVTNLNTLEKRRGAVERFMQGYRETLDWMYSDPAALKRYAEFSGLPESVVRHAREFIPKETILPGKIVGMDQIIADAVKLKFIANPLTKEQIEDFVKIPAPRG